MTGVGAECEGRSVALGDINGDRKMDLVITSPGRATRLFLNQLTEAEAIGIRARGMGANPWGVGCQLHFIDQQGALLAAHAMAGGGSGWQSQNDPLVLFPHSLKAHQIRVLWPGGAMRSYALDPSQPLVLIAQEDGF